MASEGNFLFMAAMDVKPEKEDAFNEVYDTEHIPFLLKVPGILSAARYRIQGFEMTIGGKKQTVSPSGEPSYLAAYEFESAEVLSSEGWLEGVEHGRWPTDVRPYTLNRRHHLYKRI